MLLLIWYSAYWVFIKPWHKEVLLIFTVPGLYWEVFATHFHCNISNDSYLIFHLILLLTTVKWTRWKILGFGRRLLALIQMSSSSFPWSGVWFFWTLPHSGMTICQFWFDHKAKSLFSILIQRESHWHLKKAYARVGLKDKLIKKKMY